MKDICLKSRYESFSFDLYFLFLSKIGNGSVKIPVDRDADILMPIATVSETVRGVFFLCLVDLFRIR